MPFPCRQEWTGSTRSTTRRAPTTVDWNRTDDVCEPVVASGAGARHAGREPRRQQLRALRLRRPRLRREHALRPPRRGVRHPRPARRPGRADRAARRLGRTPPAPTCTTNSGSTAAASRRGSTTSRSRCGSTRRSGNCVDVPIAGDWNGDGVAEVGVFRRSPTGNFGFDLGRRGPTRSRSGPPPTTRSSVTGTATASPTGRPGRRVEHVHAAARRRQHEVARLRLSPPTARSPGDWDGDGASEIGVWRPSEAAFCLRAHRRQPTRSASARSARCR